MRFSRRTAWDRTPNEMARLLEGAAAPGMIDLTEGNPTRAGLQADPLRLAAALSDPGNALYEPHPLGLPRARATLARRLGERGLRIAADRVVLTASTSEAYAYLFKLCCDPGDAVVTPSPSYPLFDFLARLADVEAASWRLRLGEDRWSIDVDAVAASLPERARVLLVVSPNNPTGSVLDEAEARGLAALCRERGMALVSDEVFADFHWNGEPRPSVVLDACAREGCLGVVLSGLSKACGLPQLKLGWMLVGGPDDVVGEALARLELVADTYLSVGTPVQRGLDALLDLGEDFRARVRPRLAANLATLRAGAATCGARVLPAEAGWYAALALPEGADDQAVTQRLAARDGVLVHPGWLFDMPLPSLVVSLLPEPSAFARGAAAIARIEKGV